MVQIKPIKHENSSFAYLVNGRIAILNSEMQLAGRSAIGFDLTETGPGKLAYQAALWQWLCLAAKQSIVHLDQSSYSAEYSLISVRPFNEKWLEESGGLFKQPEQDELFNRIANKSYIPIFHCSAQPSQLRLAGNALMLRKRKLIKLYECIEPYGVPRFYACRSDRDLKLSGLAEIV